MTILRAEAPHDFLALVPSLAGYRPQNSIVCVAFRGNLTCAVFRVDLPAPGDDHGLFTVVDAVVGLLCTVPGADAAVPVIFTDASFSGRGLPQHELGRRLVTAIAENGFLVRDALCEASDGWGSYIDDDCPAKGRSLDLVTHSRLAVAARERLGTPLDAVDSPGRLPDASDRDRRALERTLSRLRRELDGDDEPKVLDQVFEIADPSPVSWVEYCATRPADTVTRLTRAWLAVLLQSPPTRDQAMLQFAFGELAGLAAISDQESWERGDDVGEDDSIAEVLLGRCTLRPDAKRTQNAIELLRTLAATLPDEYRPPVLCMLAWLLWALGRGSAAGRAIDSALGIDADYGMARAMHTLLGAAIVPEWLFVHPSARQIGPGDE